MFDVKMDLIEDWIKTVKEVFRGSGYPLEDGISEEELALLYYEQTLEGEQAQQAAAATLTRLRELEAAIRDNLSAVIVPDIRKRTGYKGDLFHFCWVYNQGEHIIEMESEYRIPLQ
ncbi:hypothetical protein [Paenibacillus chungangensis]|uniref:Uncharacterized protein n=1 Tax=Paenibacillus chungangensis TaxID=696535 RepID=A0ABW3HTQ9_9BACL